MLNRSRLAAPYLRGCLMGAVLALSGPGRAADADGGLFSVTKPAFGLVDGQLFAGEGTGSLDGTGSLRVVAQAGPDGAPPNPPIACQGRFEHNLRTGKGRLTCDNGETADFTFRFTGLTSGLGEGQSKTHGPIRFTFGLDAEAAARALGLPAGTRIRIAGGAAGTQGQPAYRLEKAAPETSPETAQTHSGEPTATLPSPVSAAGATTPAPGSGAGLLSPASAPPR